MNMPRSVAAMSSRGRGGSRQGAPGAAYANRSDLTGQKLPVATAPGQPYGESKQLIQAQRAVPMAAPQAPAAPAPAQPQAGAGGAAGQSLADILTQIGLQPRSLTGPTRTPNPVTHGLPVGPGAGPEVLSTPSDDYLGQLRAIYAQHPTEALRELIAFNSGGAV